jgi:predicted MFS family arabinose efflux permease
MSIASSRAVAVALVAFATFTDLLAYSICVPVLPDLARRLGASPTTIGVLFGSFGITLLAVSVPIGAFSDVVGRKPLLIGGSLLLAGATLFFASATSLLWLFAARLLQGAADGIMWVAGFALIADLYGPAARGRVMGYVMSGTSLGIMVGPSIGGWLYELGGIRLPFVFVSALALASAAGFALIAPGRPRGSGVSPSIWSVLRVRGVALCAALVIVAATTIAMFEPVLPLFFSADLGLTPARIGLVFGAAAVASTVMPFFYGPLIAKFGGRRLTVLGLVLCALWMPTLGLATGFASAVTLVVIQWMAISLVITPSLAYMADVTSIAGAEAYGIGYGVYNTAWALGLLLGPAAGGFLLERLGFAVLMIAWAPCLLAATFLLSRSAARPGRATAV